MHQCNNLESVFNKTLAVFIIIDTFNEVTDEVAVTAKEVFNALSVEVEI